MGQKTIRRGDVFYVEKYPSCGSEQRPARPGIIVSNDSCNRNSEVVEVVYLTCQKKNPLPTHVKVLCGGRQSTALCEQITSVAVERLGDYKCHLSNEEMQQIDMALLNSLGIQMSEEKSNDPERECIDDGELAMVAVRFLDRFLRNANAESAPMGRISK